MSQPDCEFEIDETIYLPRDVRIIFLQRDWYSPASIIALVSKKYMHNQDGCEKGTSFSLTFVVWGTPQEFVVDSANCLRVFLGICVMIWYLYSINTCFAENISGEKSLCRKGKTKEACLFHPTDDLGV